MHSLPPGTLLGQRFAIEALVGAGGMGCVYRARDTRTGNVAAIKVMLTDTATTASSNLAARFVRESKLLARLRHPAIVAFLESGSTEAGEPFLAMEWLEGEDLERRIEKSPLTIAETIAMARRIAGALGEAHKHGIVHRDIKPSNIYLRDGDVERATLLDFGIARRVASNATVAHTLWATAGAKTATGAIMGTPFYMAPEQARAEPDVGPAADVFSLGCVLYECLALRPPFMADHLAALLAQILFAEPPALKQVRPDIPNDLEALISASLAKDAAARPPIADVLETLHRFHVSSQVQTLTTTAKPAGLGRAEQQLVTTILASVPTTVGHDLTLTPEEVSAMQPPMDRISKKLAALGVHAEVPADQSIVVTLSEQTVSARDQANLAAICATTISECWPAAVVAIATGPSALREGRATGETLAQAGRMLAMGLPSSEKTTHGRILVEDVTAGLIGVRAQLTRVGQGISVLVGGTLYRVDESRPFLGKPTPCVGRDAEISTLEAALSSCIDEGTSRAVLVTGPPGIGKSRLRHELCRRIEARSETVEVVVARSEPLRSGIPFGILGEVLRKLCGVLESASVDEQRASIRDVAAKHHPEDHSMAEFLGELCGVPFPDETHVQLRAARQNPRVMNERLRHAWTDFMRAQGEAHPVVLIIEDLHWSDRLSVEFIDEVLQNSSELPFLVIAFARPEVVETFPNLWKNRLQEIPLRPLAKKACQRLVQQAAAQLAPNIIERIIERSAGNALFLEELTRAAVEGSDEDAPETVLAMLHARIGRLDANARHVLRAASIFGQTFTEEGLGALIGSDTSPEEIRHALRTVVEQEIAEARRDGDGSGRTYRFRHALMRDAAYARFTSEDRKIGHRLAAAFLHAMGAPSVLVAEHYVESDTPGEAIGHFIRAARRAAEQFNTHSLEDYVRRARAFAPTGEDLGVLLCYEALVLGWKWQWRNALELSRQAIPLVKRGSAPWGQAMHIKCYCACYVDPNRAIAEETADVFLETPPTPATLVAYCDYGAHMASALVQTGSPHKGLVLLQRTQAIAGEVFDKHPAVRAWHNLVWCSYHRYTDDDVAKQIALATEAVHLYEQNSGEATMRVLSQDVLGELLARAGQVDEAVRILRRTVEMARALNMVLVISHANLALANVLVAQGEMDLTLEAEALIHTILKAPNITAGYRAMSSHVLAHVYLMRNEFDKANAEIVQAIELSEHTPTRRLQMKALQIRLLVQKGDLAAAAEASRAALADLDAVGQGGYGELPLLAAATDGLLAAGETEGESVLRRAYAYLMRSASSFTDPAARELFLMNVKVHARLVTLAREHLA